MGILERVVNEQYQASQLEMKAIHGQVAALSNSVNGIYKQLEALAHAIQTYTIENSTSADSLQQSKTKESSTVRAELLRNSSVEK